MPVTLVRETRSLVPIGGNIGGSGRTCRACASSHFQLPTRQSAAPPVRTPGGASRVGDYDDGVALDMQEMLWFGPWLLREASRLPPDQKLFKLNCFDMVVMFREAMQEWKLVGAVP